MKVKVCGLKDRENIREIVSCKPDFLGFIFSPTSPRYVGESFDVRLMRNIPPYINKTGVFVNQDYDTILMLVERYGLNYVQLHGHEDVSFTAALKARKIGIIKVFQIDEYFDFGNTEPFLSVCEYVLFDTKSEIAGGSGKKFNWQVLKQFSFPKPFFLSGGITQDDADSILAIQHPYLLGVDMNSGFEIRPGLKDVFKVNEFIKVIKKKQG
jgi:phosphoribosylanthranilate isomerase